MLKLLVSCSIISVLCATVVGVCSTHFMLLSVLALKVTTIHIPVTVTSDTQTQLKQYLFASVD